MILISTLLLYYPKAKSDAYALIKVLFYTIMRAIAKQTNYPLT
ncbi:hypothetical protein [Nostoc sp.]